MLKKGQLIRWVVDYEAFEGYSDSSKVKGIGAIYRYGVVMETETDKKTIVVCCYEKKIATWSLVNVALDRELEVVSE